MNSCRRTGAEDAGPLVIELEGARYPQVSIRDHFESEYEAWREWSGENEEAGGFVLPVAPDRLHKANVSGGDPYGIRLPDGTAEGLFVGEVAMPFVAYLSLVFRHGGFPAAVPGDRQWTIKRELASGSGSCSGPGVATSLFATWRSGGFA